MRIEKELNCSGLAFPDNFSGNDEGEDEDSVSDDEEEEEGQE